MSEFNFELELSLRAGVSVKVSQFGLDLSKLVVVVEIECFFWLEGRFCLDGRLNGPFTIYL